jgi:dTDP-glucose 4,6-dehydratase
MPNSPYAASKAGADVLVRSYFKTYGIPAIITRSSNNFGPYQYPEKVIPLFITNALEDKPLPLYGDGKNVRDWLYVLDNCRAIDTILHKGKPGEIYNIGGGNELSNIELTVQVLKFLKKPASLIKRVKDRAGHDRRYSLDCSKIRRVLGFKPGNDFSEALRATVRWYVENEAWWKKLKNKAFKKYYKAQYQSKH